MHMYVCLSGHDDVFILSIGDVVNYRLKSMGTSQNPSNIIRSVELVRAAVFCIAVRTTVPQLS